MPPGYTSNVPLRGTALLAHRRSASCGAGGIRTLVQTTVPRAFYMLILSLVFDRGPGKGTLAMA